MFFFIFNKIIIYFTTNILTNNNHINYKKKNLSSNYIYNDNISLNSNNKENFNYIPQSVNYDENPLRIDLANVSSKKSKFNFNTENYEKLNKYEELNAKVNYTKKRTPFKYPNKRSKNLKVKIIEPDEIINRNAIEISGLDPNSNYQKKIKTKKTIDPTETNKIIEDKYRNGTFIVPNFNNHFLDPIKSYDDETLKTKIESNKLKDISKSNIDAFKFKELGNYIDYSLK